MAYQAGVSAGLPTIALRSSAAGRPLVRAIRREPALPLVVGTLCVLSGLVLALPGSAGAAGLRPNPLILAVVVLAAYLGNPGGLGIGLMGAGAYAFLLSFAAASPDQPVAAADWVQLPLLAGLGLALGQVRSSAHRRVASVDRTVQQLSEAWRSVYEDSARTARAVRSLDADLDRQRLAVARLAGAAQRAQTNLQSELWAGVAEAAQAVGAVDVRVTPVHHPAIRVGEGRGPDHVTTGTLVGAIRAADGVPAATITVRGAPEAPLHMEGFEQLVGWASGAYQLARRHDEILRSLMTPPHLDHRLVPACGPAGVTGHGDPVTTVGSAAGGAMRGQEESH